MKREILFRGKCKRTGRWLYGDLIQWKSQGRCAITPQEGDCWESPSDFEVEPETVGEYTGMEDAKGNRVFEGDVLYEIDLNPFYYKVVFEGGEFTLVHENFYRVPIDGVYKLQVASNIHDQ